MRHCSKPGCKGSAISTLTYDYRNSTVVLGPLATTAEPHSYDLCEKHATQLTVPRGWDVVRLEINYDAVMQSDDDLMALVEAVRDAAEYHPSSAVSGGTIGFTSFGENVDLSEPLPAPRHQANLTVIAGEAEAPTEPATDVSAAEQPPESGPY